MIQLLASLQVAKACTRNREKAFTSLLVVDGIIQVELLTAVAIELSFKGCNSRVLYWRYMPSSDLVSE